MKNINELIGIIKGISFDGVINDREIEKLHSWVSKNRNLAINTKDVSLIKIVDSVLADGVITTEERELLLLNCKNYRETSTGNVALYELNGIIEGIICDDVVNEAEIRRLKTWMSENGELVRDSESTARLCEIVDNVIADDVVTEEEQNILLKLLSERINDSKLRTKVEYLCKQVKAHKNIGLDLIDLLDNEEAIEVIHEESEKQMFMALGSYTGAYMRNPEIVFVSLVLIAMLHYDAGNFYGMVRNTYEDLYRKYPNQKIEGLIRTVLNKYRVGEAEGKERIINVALLNAIVPGNYLKAFFEFIFDIYEKNFEYTLVDDLYGEFQFVYEGLRSSMLSDGDELKLNVTKKTYKLIKTTKQIITNKNSVDAVINLSIIVIKLIDKRIWNKELHIYNPYLKKGFDGWVATLKDDESEATRKSSSDSFRSRWQPRFYLINNKVVLAPPIHRVKSDYNFWDICAVVENNGKVVCTNSEPDIREIIGGFRVNVESMSIENPLGKLRYKLMAGSSVIYDSGEKLFREFLVFDAQGNEISNNTDYTGTAVYVYSTSQTNLKAYRNETYYDLASQNVHVGDTCMIGNTVFNFCALFKPGIFGEDYLNHFLIDDKTGKEISVFKKVKLLIFESDQLDASFEIIQDGSRRRLTDYKHTVSSREGANKYVIEVPVMDVGFHSFEVYQILKGKRTKILDVDFAVDRLLEVGTRKLNDEIYEVSVNSSLCSLIEKEVTTESFDPDGIQFEYDNRSYHYCIPFEFEFYRIDEQTWKSLRDGIWVGELKQDSVVEIYGTDIEGMLMYSSIGRPIEDIPKIRTKRNVQQIPVGFLITYKSSYDYVVMMFMKNGRVSQALFCDYKCNMNDNGTDILFDPAEKKLSITPFYNGKGNVFVSILDKHNNLVIRSNYLKSGEAFITTEIESFTEYAIKISEKELGLVIKPERVMQEIKQKFFAWNDFVGTKFRISEIEYNAAYSSEENYLIHKYSNMTMEFKKKLSEDSFEGEIYMDGYKQLPQYQKLNPVVIHIDGDVLDDKLDVSVTKGGFSLYTEGTHFGLFACHEEPQNYQVKSFTLEMDGYKKV